MFMIMRSKVALTLILLLLTLAASGQTRKEKKEMKEKEREEQFVATGQLLESGSFEFNADWANSFQGARINLVTNPNHLRMEGESAKIYLPYYGVAHTSDLAFSNQGGIVYEGSLEDYRLEVNEKKMEYTIRFRCKADRENLEFIMTVYASGHSRLNVNSNIRTGMTYEGQTGPPSIKI